MTKLAWILVPLLAAALWVAVLAWRGRQPSRPALNAWSSLLLLAYLGTTAGLGIFWVANQHLPVFDWHYLFGYATLALLVLHLALNARALWAHLRPRRAAVPVAERRRPLAGALALGGLALATGMAYWMGLRHGRSELRIAFGGGGAEAGGLAVVEAFHHHSAHSRAGVLQRAPSAQWASAPPLFKRLDGRSLRPLPEPWRATPGMPPPLDTRALATLLWHAAGITAQRGGLVLRAAPSSGALFATELYVAARRIGDLPPGLWHYDVQRGALSQLPAQGPSEFDAILPPDAALAIIATAVFARSGHKYGDRTYRYVLADLGHLLENLRASAAALQLPLVFAAAFDESRLAQALQIDESDEGVLALLWLREPGSEVAAEAPAAAAPPRPAPPVQAAASTPLAMTEAVHRATSLRAPLRAATMMPASAAAHAAAAAQPPGTVLPPPSLAAYDALPLIAARRSVRRYRSEPVPLQALSDLLAAVQRHAGVLSGAVGVHVVAHAVQGLAEAAWRYDGLHHVLRPSPAAAPVRRARTRAAALDQDAAGDAAAVFVLTIARAALARDPDGAARGYRHAFLEAGLMGERLYLQAQALGLGVCAVGAFYDDEAAALVGIDPALEWPVHVVTLGWPA